MTEVRKRLDALGIKPWKVTEASMHRIMRLHERCQAEKYFGDNDRAYQAELEKVYKRKRPG